MGANDWNEWSRHILASLERMEKAISVNAQELKEFKAQMADYKETVILPLRVRVAVISIVAGSLAGSFMSIVIPLIWKLF